ncbi:MAG: hypothetical protein JSS32_04250 [Verrucomicrobia bacterium]|nr:hypothetical protein [Verrucomicrobiota bacterium]
MSQPASNNSIGQRNQYRPPALNLQPQQQASAETLEKIAILNRQLMAWKNELPQMLPYPDLLAAHLQRHDSITAQINQLCFSRFPQPVLRTSHSSDQGAGHFAVPQKPQGRNQRRAPSNPEISSFPVPQQNQRRTQSVSQVTASGVPFPQRSVSDNALASYQPLPITLHTVDYVSVQFTKSAPGSAQSRASSHERRVESVQSAPVSPGDGQLSPSSSVIVEDNDGVIVESTVVLTNADSSGSAKLIEALGAGAGSSSSAQPARSQEEEDDDAVLSSFAEMVNRPNIPPQKSDDEFLQELEALSGDLPAPSNTSSEQLLAELEEMLK